MNKEETNMVDSDQQIIELKLGDSFERLKEIPSDSIDAVVSDPPY
jgi:DNA modification methylase